MKKYVLFLFVLLFSVPVYGMDDTRIFIRTSIPHEITTIGEAAEYYAQIIGYELKTSPPAPPESLRISEEPISILVNKNEIKPIDEAILALLKERYKLVIDKKHKLFSFKETTE